jgi:hypothetical protein
MTAGLPKAKQFTPQQLAVAFFITPFGYAGRAYFDSWREGVWLRAWLN